MPKNILNHVRKYVDPFRVTKGKDFRLKDFDPDNTLGLKMDKREASDLLQRGSEWLAMEQDILYAQDSWALLLVFQAMDAAGRCQNKFSAVPAVLALAHEQPVPIFQQLARGHPSGRDDVREISAVAAQCRGSVGRAGDRHQPRDRSGGTGLARCSRPTFVSDALRTCAAIRSGAGTWMRCS